MATLKFHQAKDPEAKLILAYVFGAAIETHKEQGMPLPAEPSPEFLAKLWVDGKVLVAVAWEGENIVAVIVSLISPTVFGEPVQTTLVRFTDPAVRHKGVGRAISRFVDNYFRSKGVKLATSVVQPDTPGHRFMAGEGAVYPLIAGYREL